MNHIKVVLDTNVIISAILFGGLPRKVFELVIKGELEVYISAPILDEIKDVLIRPKFGFSTEQAGKIADEIYSISRFVSPQKHITVVKDDPDDNMILECAVKAHASYIITGDSHLLDIMAFKEISIISPAEFLEAFSIKKDKLTE
jgi:putative PIN family toxin of toxin-antitoxin system